MTNAPEPTPPAVREIRQLIERRRRELEDIDADMLQTQHALTSLFGQRERMQALIDDLARVLVSLTTATDADEPTPDAYPLSVAHAVKCPTCGAWPDKPCVTERAEVLPGVHPDRYRDGEAAWEAKARGEATAADPLAHRCPDCGANVGEACQGLDWGTFHARRPGTGWKLTVDPELLHNEPAKPAAEQIDPLSVACSLCGQPKGAQCIAWATALKTKTTPHIERIQAAKRAARG